MAEASENRKQANMGRRLVLGVVFGIVVYAGILIWLDADSILKALRKVAPATIFAALGLAFANYLIRFIKWERYRKLLSIEMDGGTSFLIYMSGFSMGITPGKMGEVFKSWLIKRLNGTPIHHSAPIVIAERYTDLLGYLILMAIGGLRALPEYQWVFWVTLAACVGALFLAGSPRFSEFVAKTLSRTPFLWRLSGKVRGSFASTRILLAPKEVIMPTLLSVISWGCECVAFWLIADALLEQDVDFLFCVFAYAFSAVAGAVAIIFPGGLGITEYAGGSLLRRHYQVLMPAAGASTEALKQAAQVKAAAAMILTRLCTLWFAVLLGLIATALFRLRYGKADTAEESD